MVSLMDIQNAQKARDARALRDRKTERAVAEAARPTLISTGTRSTSTPAKSDETPREAPFGGELVERLDKLHAAKARPGYPFDADTVAETAGASALGARLGVGKVSSPELASLAAKYLNADTYTLEHLSTQDAERLAADVRRLAASVLSQAEGDAK